MHERAALNGLHHHDRQPVGARSLVALARFDGFALPVGVIDLQLHEVHLGMRLQHLFQHGSLVVDGEAQVADQTRLLLLVQEVPQAEVVEQARALLAQVMQQEEVEITRPRLAQRLVEHGARMIGVFRQPRRQLRGNLERFARIALDDGLAQRRLRPAVMVAARRVEIGEARVHEQVYHMLDLLDVDLLAAVALDDGQPHEPEAQLPDLVHR